MARVIQAYFVGDSVQTHEDVGPGQIAMHLYSPDDPGYLVAAAMVGTELPPPREYPPRPSEHHVWQDGAWIDPRTPEDIEAEEAAALAAERAAMVASRFQAKAALMQAGLLDAAEAAIAASDTLTRLAWAEAVEYRRDSPAIASIAAALGLTDAQVDDLFRAAMQIAV